MNNEMSPINIFLTIVAIGIVIFLGFMPRSNSSNNSQSQSSQKKDDISNNTSDTETDYKETLKKGQEENEPNVVCVCTVYYNKISEGDTLTVSSYESKDYNMAGIFPCKKCESGTAIKFMKQGYSTSEGCYNK